MTEEMISQLGALDPKRLGVIARTSAVKYKNSGKGIDQIGHDPNFALGYAGQADAYAEQADADLAPEKAFALSKQAALRALSINPDLAEAHVSLANALFYSEWKWTDAEREYKRALELKPAYEEAHHSYPHYL